MATATVTVTTNNSSAGVDMLPAKTSLRGLMDGTAPITLGNGLKAAFVTITFDGGNYASGGIEINVLDYLPGWTAVLGAVPAVWVDTNPKIAHYNAETDKVIAYVLAGTEHTVAAISDAVTMLFLGY